jgi:crotonobetainyl-CoA:carnitine CoA-transferase CaiB-like acyl-CoA transferase
MIGRPELGTDPDFRTFKERLKNRERITAVLDEILCQRTTAEWLTHFAGRVPVAPVNDVASALDNPFVREHGRIWEVPHPARADFKMVAAPYACPGDEFPRRPAPALGQDTDQLLSECGFSRERIEALRGRGVI